MDRREAIEILTEYRRYAIRETITEALDLAIEALGVAESATTTDCNYTCSDCKHQDKAYEQEPCYSCFNNDGAGYEPDTDCISRADTIKAMCQECKVFPDDEVNCADCTEVAIVRGMPSVSGEEVDYCNNCPYISYNNEDCISRQQAIEALMAHFIPQTYTGEQVEQAEKLAQKIMNKVPPVTPTERTGEWEHDGSDWENRWVCSECGYKLFEEQTTYCGNCGAKMGGDTE